jgi:1-acyl-sn-glycerol-3-phosphate acyltransferase
MMADAARSAVPVALMPHPTPPPSDHPELERRLLQLVGELVSELRPGSAAAGVGLNDSLERELGLGSLERVELLSRIQRDLGLRLPDDVMAGADTPADLARALSAADPSQVETRPSEVASVGDGMVAPDTAGTLVEVLEWHAKTHPDRIHIFLRAEDGSEQPITYDALWRWSVSVASALRGRGIGRRDTVTIMLRTEADFFPAFFGTLLAGAIPVPIYPPFRADRIAEYAERQVGILSNAGTRLMITFAEVERLAALLRGRVPTLVSITTLVDLAPDVGRTIDAPDAMPANPAPWLTPEDPALIQYTSGSTGQPKGVLLTHANLVANVRAIVAGLEVEPSDVLVSWLPLYHDMGLIGAWLGTMYAGIPVAILSPLAFLSRPARWLWAIHAHRATLAAAPNFAFDLCVAKIPDEELAGLDLSSLRSVLNGSEAVLPDTMTRFTARFAPLGFRPKAMRPVYGLAECSVGLAVTPRRSTPRVDRVDRVFQTTGLATPSSASDALAFVACGVPLPKHEIRVVDDRNAPVGERVEGPVQFRGPSMMAGYYRNPAATRAVTTDDGWIDTGDLGYLADAELFLTGRSKDVIIKGGRNIYPHEAEALVATVAGVRKGCVAAFGVADTEVGTERLVVVAETRETEPTARERLREAVHQHIADALGIPPDTVVLTRPGSVFKTSSGKVRRGATKGAYLDGSLDRGTGSMVTQWLTLGAQSISARCTQAVSVVLRLGYTGYILGLVLVALPLLWALVLTSRRTTTVRRWLTRFSRFVVAASGCPLDVTGQEHLRDLGPAIFVANHASYFDVVVILATLPANLRFAAKGRLAHYPILGTIIPKAKYIALHKTKLTEQMEGADDVSSALTDGESMFVFPEGTFVRAPGLLPFRLGAFRGAADSGRPVVPIALAGTRHIFPAGTMLLRPGPITLTISPRLTPSSAGWKETVRLRDESRRFIEHHVGEAAG